jgi:hypothetical protein
MYVKKKGNPNPNKSQLTETKLVTYMDAMINFHPRSKDGFEAISMISKTHRNNTHTS